MENKKDKKWYLQLEVLAIVFAVLSLVFLILALPYVPSIFEKEMADYINNVLVGLATGFIGMLITITYVQNALEEQSKKNEKIEEYKKIVRYSKYAKILISKYIQFFNFLVTYEEEAFNQDDKFVESFELVDLKNIYNDVYIITEPPFTPAIFCFYSIEKELFDYLLCMNQEIDFKYSSDLYEVLYNYFNESKTYDSRNSIIGWYNNSKYRPLADKMIEMVQKYPDRDFEKEFDNNDELLKSNTVIPLIMLYKFLKYQKEGIERYLQEVGRIENELNELI